MRCAFLRATPAFRPASRRSVQCRAGSVSRRRLDLMTLPMTWMIYGANGYTGTLLAEEAVRRGHKPVLAGRSAEKIRPLADRLGLSVREASLDDPARLRAIID